MAQPGTDSPPRPPTSRFLPDVTNNWSVWRSGRGDSSGEGSVSCPLRHIYKQGLLRQKSGQAVSQTRCLCPGDLGRENWPGDHTDPQVAGQGVRKNRRAELASALNLGSRYPPAPGRGETEQKVQHWKKPNLLAPHTTQVTPVSSGWSWVLPDLQHAVPGPTCRAGFELGPLAASTGNDHPSGGGPGHLLTQ